VKPPGLLFNYTTCDGKFVLTLPRSPSIRFNPHFFGFLFYHQCMWPFVLINGVRTPNFLSFTIQVILFLRPFFGFFMRGFSIFPSWKLFLEQSIGVDWQHSPFPQNYFFPSLLAKIWNFPLLPPSLKSQDRLFRTHRTRQQKPFCFLPFPFPHVSILTFLTGAFSIPFFIKPTRM